MSSTQPAADTLTLAGVSTVANIPLPCFVTNGDVDVMEVEAVLRSNDQPCPRDHDDDAYVGMPGINFPSLPHYPVIPQTITKGMLACL